MLIQLSTRPPHQPRRGKDSWERWPSSTANFLRAAMPWWSVSLTPGPSSTVSAAKSIPLARSGRTWPTSTFTTGSTASTLTPAPAGWREMRKFALSPPKYVTISILHYCSYQNLWETTLTSSRESIEIWKWSFYQGFIVTMNRTVLCRHVRSL